MATSTTPTAAAAPAPRPPRTASLFVDASGRVLFVDAGEDAAPFLSSLLATARELLRDREDNPASAADGCLGNLVAAEALLPRANAAATSASRAPPPPASPASAPRVPKGMGIMSRRLFRCGHLACPCSDVASRTPGSACPCASPPCARAAAAAAGTRDTELHFLEACFYRRPDGSAAAGVRGAGRSGDAFYRCRVRDERRGRGRDVFPCRFRVTDERGVECPLCGGRTSVPVKCAEAGDNGEDSSVSARPDAGRGGEAGGPATSYAIMDDLTVRPVAAGLRGAALLSALGVAADPADVRELTVPFGYKEGLSVLLAALRSNTALTDFFVPAAARPTRRRRHL